jgi:serpin B
MYIFMPGDYHRRDADALPAWLEALTPRSWNDAMTKFHEGDISVGLPRFRVETEPPVQEALRAMGIQRAFAEQAADFSPMSKKPLWISSIRHKTLLDVNEEGTTAAAMVVELITTTGILPSIEVDRPFFLAIRDDRTGLILFAGVVYDPPRAAGR